MPAGIYDIIVITGPTASGKTGFAAMLASKTGGEVISADSRQVYRRMDIGTGKDYNDYMVEGKRIPFHMIDIVDPGYRYNVFEYQRDFLDVYRNLKKRNILPVVCGGSGMYLDSIISGYKLIRVPVNQQLRGELADKSLQELTQILGTYRTLHNKTDTDNRKRAIRAIEIEEYYLKQGEDTEDFPQIKPLILGIRFEREERRRRISSRLGSRLDSGMIEEVRSLLKSGVTEDDLVYYGLEYRHITYYLNGRLSYEEMKKGLETAIHRFAKRQMTWFRRMERRGIKIHWIDGELDDERKLDYVKSLIR